MLAAMYVWTQAILVVHDMLVGIVATVDQTRPFRKEGWHSVL